MGTDLQVTTPGRRRRAADLAARRGVDVNEAAGADFVAKLRDERKFDGLEPLKAQMALDSRSAREVLGMNPRLVEA